MDLPSLQSASLLAPSVNSLKPNTLKPNSSQQHANSSTYPQPNTVTAIIIAPTETPELAATLAAVKNQTSTANQVRVVATIDQAKITATGSEWIWFLHDDSVPAPTALAELLRVTEHSTSISVVGSKQLSWPDSVASKGTLTEVGHSVTGSGRRFNDLEPGEIDQGQYDDKADVLAVDLAGALVSGTMWQRLGGFDPIYEVAGAGKGRKLRREPNRDVRAGGADTDFCRRVWRAGGRVVVAPAAVIYHARHLMTYRATRLSQTLHALIHCGRIQLSLAVFAIWLSAPVRAVWQLATGHAKRAAVELTLPLLVLHRALGIVKSRRELNLVAQVPAAVLRPLLASWPGVLRQRRDQWRAQAELRRPTQPPNPLEQYALTLTKKQNRLGLLLVLAVTLGATVALFGPHLGSLMAGHRLVGGALLPAPGTFGSTWAVSTAGWSNVLGANVASWLPGAGVGIGQNISNTLGTNHGIPADPLLTVLALLTALTGSLQLTVHLIMLLALPVAGFGGWLVAGRFTRATSTRIVAGLAWGFAPPLLVALPNGQLGNVVVHLTLPLLLVFGISALGMTTGGQMRVRSRRGLLAMGLLTAITVAGAPALVALAALGTLLIAIFTSRDLKLYSLLTLLPTAVLGAPYWLYLSRQPAAWPALVQLPLAPWQFGAAGAVASVVLLILVVSAVVLATKLARWFRSHPRLLVWVARPSSAVIFALPLAVGALWLAQQPLTGADAIAPTPSVLPAIAANQTVLYIRHPHQDELEFAVLTADGSALSQFATIAQYQALARAQYPNGELVEPSDGDLAELIADLGTGADTANLSRLTALGISLVQVPAPQPGQVASSELVANLDMTPGLVRLTDGTGPIVWRIDPPPIQPGSPAQPSSSSIAQICPAEFAVPAGLTSDDPEYATAIPPKTTSYYDAATMAVGMAGELRGLAIAPCARPTTEHWLVGGATTVGNTALLTLTNPNPVAATATIEVYGPLGVVPLGSRAQMLVPPNDAVSLPLTAVAQDLSRMAIHVTAKGASLAASVQLTSVAGLEPRGISYLAPGAMPQSIVTLPGVRSDGQEIGSELAPILRIVVPVATATANNEGGSAARITIIGADGPVRLRGSEAIALPDAGGIVDVPLGGLPAGEYAVIVSAERPIIAAIRLTPLSNSGRQSQTWLAAQEPSRSSSAVVPPGLVGSLVVTGPAQTTIQVEITSLGSSSLDSSSLDSSNSAREPAGFEIAKDELLVIPIPTAARARTVMVTASNPVNWAMRLSVADLVAGRASDSGENDQGENMWAYLTPTSERENLEPVVVREVLVTNRH